MTTSSTQILAKAIETKTIAIDGISCTLERRVCLNGCQKDFWVLPESPARHARSDCVYVCNVTIDKIPEHIMKRFDSYPQIDDSPDLVMEKISRSKNKFIMSNNNKTKPKRIEKVLNVLKEDEPGYQMQVDRWMKAVLKSKQLIESKDQTPRFREDIAEIAFAVVTNKKNFSIKCFSALLGIDRKTLQNWIHVKYDVINKIDNYDGNFLAARKSRDYIKSLDSFDKYDLNDIYEAEKVKTEKIPSPRTIKNMARLIKAEAEALSAASESRIKIYKMKVKIRSIC